MKQCTFTFFMILILSVGCKDKETPPANAPHASVKKEETIPASTVKHIVFFGNSLTAGYGVDLSEAFPALIQDKIDSLKLPYKVINAGLSGETTAGGRSRIEWLFRQSIDVFILELGGNDGLRGIPLTETSRNLQAIIDKVKQKYPDVKLILAGMLIPPNMGSKYANEFRGVFRQLAAKNDVYFIPFVLEGVGGVQRLNQSDGIHPTAEGHKIVADNIWKLLKDIL